MRRVRCAVHRPRSSQPLAMRSCGILVASTSLTETALASSSWLSDRTHGESRHTAARRLTTPTLILSESDLTAHFTCLASATCHQPSWVSNIMRSAQELLARMAACTSISSLRSHPPRTPRPRSSSPVPLRTTHHLDHGNRPIPPERENLMLHRPNNEPLARCLSARR